MKTKLVRIGSAVFILLALVLFVAPKPALATAKTSTGGAWGTAGTWSPSGVPTATDDVTILSGTVTVSVAAIAHNVTINSGATLNPTGAGLTVYGNWTNNGTFTMVSAQGVTFAASSGTQTISSSGTGGFRILLIDCLGSCTPGANVQLLTNVTVGATGDTGNILQLKTGNLDLNSYTLTLSIGTQTTNRGIRVQGNRTILGTGGGTLLTSGGSEYVCGIPTGGTCGGTDWTNTGTLTIGSGATMALGTGVDLSASTTGATIINGTLQINSGGSLLNSHTPTYGSASTLAYNTTMSVGGEWGAGTAVGSGVPQNVTILAGTVTMPAGARTVPGNLTINSGSTLVLNTTSGNDLNVGGNWSNSGTFTHNSRTVNFNGSSAQSISGATTFSTLKINNATGVTLASAVTVASTLTIGDLTANSVFNDGGFQVASTGTLNFTSGTFKLGSTGTATTFPAFTARTISAGTTVEYAAGVAQTISNTPSYQNLTVSGAGTKTPAGALSIAGNLAVNAGTLDLSTYTANRSSAGGTLTVSNGATLKIGGTNSFPSNYSSHTLGGTSTVEYSGSTQAVSAETYGNLTISASGTKTLGGSATVNGALALTSGDLTTGANTLTMSDAATTTGNYDVIGTVSRLSPTTGGNHTYGSQYTSLTFTVNSTVTVSVTMQKSVNGFTSKYVKRQYTLTVPGGQANVQLHYQSPGDLVGSPNESQLVLYRNNGIKWAEQGASARTSNGNASSVTLNSVYNFSDWAIAETAAPTPITIANIEGFSGGPDLTQAAVGVGVLGIIVLGGVGWFATKRRNR